MGSFEELFPMGVSHYVIGGLFIGLGVSFLYVVTGLVGGVSSVYSAVWSYCSNLTFFQQGAHTKSRTWRLVYSAGLILGAVIWQSFPGNEVPVTTIPWWQLIVGGFIAGFGARYGNGCTSGHGICGMASLSVPSILAVVVFLSTAIVTAQVVTSLG